MLAALDSHKPEHPKAGWHLAIDGKCQLGSRRDTGAGKDRGLAMGQTHTAWCAGQGLCIALRRIPPDGGEIGRMSLLLGHRCVLKNTVVTADAAHARTHTAEVIVEGGDACMLRVKGSQPGTREALEQVF